jgi:hypothetical protein
LNSGKRQNKKSGYGKTNRKNKVRGSCMIQVKLFDQEHEKDLELVINRFLQKLDEKKLVDIKYNVVAMPGDDEGEQIYCFTAMIIYRA